MRRRGLAQKNRLLHRGRRFYSTRNYNHARACVCMCAHACVCVRQGPPIFLLGAAAAAGSVLIRKSGKHTSSHDSTCITHTHTHTRECPLPLLWVQDLLKSHTCHHLLATSSWCPLQLCTYFRIALSTSLVPCLHICVPTRRCT